MAKAVTLHPDVYNLLITNKMDDFTVSEIRDALVYSSEYFNDGNDARKYIYRVIYKLVKLGLLVKQPHDRIQKITYIKSELFFLTPFFIKMNKKFGDKADLLPSKTELFAKLITQKEKYKAKLAIVKGEVEEYKSLMELYPQQHDLFNPLYLESQRHVAQLIGKLNALNKVLAIRGIAA